VGKNGRRERKREREREREREMGEGGEPRESVPISGQSPANFGACQIHPRSVALRHPPTPLTTRLVHDRRDRCCTISLSFSPPIGARAKPRPPLSSASVTLIPSTLPFPEGRALARRRQETHRSRRAKESRLTLKVAAVRDRINR